MYDNNGNIIKRREFDFTLRDNALLEELDSTDKSYFYDGDRMMSYGGQPCAYDEIGNPLTYRDKTLTWANGRQLVGYDGHTFTYDGQGRRLTKDGISFTYDSNGRVIKQSNGLEFFYDHTGVAGVKYNTQTYFYRKDVQGNVIGLIDQNGVVIARYFYDAWGAVHAVTDNNGVEITNASHIANLNPFRYRSYYYDSDIKLYFLKTRYYDPETCRFINADDTSYLDPEKINGLNLYAYCGNNPVMAVDPDGNFPILAFILGICALVGLGLTIAGVASGNHTLTAIGLTFVAIPAFISGGMAVVAGIAGATYLGIVGGVTITAGIGSALFASAEYQQTFTGNNWMLDAGMSEGLYKGLLLTTAAIATIGTITCGILSSIGNLTTAAKSVQQTLNSIENHPQRWKITKQLVEAAKGKKYSGGISTYANYINKWTGGKAGIHKIVDQLGKIVHYHFHTLI